MLHSRAGADQLLQHIADYVCDAPIDNDETLQTARYCLLDALGCAALAMCYPECTRHLGPIVPGTKVPLGVPVPGTSHVLDPIKAAFDITTMIRWLDYNDTWLAAEWGHPSDNIGAILAAADYRSRQQQAEQKKPYQVRDVLQAMIKAHEIQGVLALDNSFNEIGLDHVILVKVASAAVATQLLGGDKKAIIDVLSHVFVDGQSLRTYRHAPNTTSRKSWAAGDAVARAMRLALMVLQGEMGLPQPLSAKRWGFCDVLWRGKALSLAQPLASYVMDNVLFKIAYPAEFHAQTAAECAIQLHAQVAARLDQIETVLISTQQSAMRIINKTGPLHNPADRDHCLQYIVAIGLIYGELTADHYQADVASDKRIDALRAKMVVQEEARFTTDYYDPNKRAIGNSVQVLFTDGTRTDRVVVDYPIGHRRRRDEGIPLLQKKWHTNLARCYTKDQAAHIETLFIDSERLLATSVPALMDSLKVK